jgi:membrane fusion protein, multidrug efflux system
MLRLAAAVLTCVLVGCRAGGDGEPSAETEPAAPAAVRTVEVRPGDVPEVLRTTGETEALSILRLASPVAGRVTFLSARAGDRLAAGEVAARVLPLESLAAVDGLHLLGRAGALGAKERAESRSLERDLGARAVTLRARFAGIVSDRFKNPGEQVATGDAVLELFDPRSLVVIAQVPADAIPRLRPKMSVRVRGAGGAVSGRIDAILTSAPPASLMVPVRVTLSSPLDPPLRNAAVDCEILVSTRRDVRVVPRSAIVAWASPSEGRVMVADGDHARLRQIETGVRAGDVVEVRSGLDLGERVLVEGQYGLADGARIRAEALTAGAGGQ